MSLTLHALPTLLTDCVLLVTHAKPTWFSLRASGSPSAFA